MNNIKALLFDDFGTVVDWRTTLAEELQAQGSKHGILPDSVDWAKLAEHWKDEIMNNCHRIAGGGQGPLNADALHRAVLDDVLKLPEWERLGAVWDDATRHDLTFAWHRFKGWPDTVEGLHALRKNHIIAPLSNGNMRLLIDMAKYAGLPWDAVLSTELFGRYKPAAEAYVSTIHHLGLKPSECALVAAHIYDLRAAAQHGMRTVYVPRVGEDLNVAKEDIKTKREGGEVDLIAKSFVELADLLDSPEA